MVSYTEKDMVDFLNKKYSATTIGTTQRYARATQVRYPTKIGYGGAKRICDYIVLDCNRPNDIIGHEIKVSRSDYLKEISDMDKSAEWKKHCHKWFIVAPPGVVQNDLPDGWGLMELQKNGKLRIKKQSEKMITQYHYPMS